MYGCLYLYVHKNVYICVFNVIWHIDFVLYKIYVINVPEYMDQASNVWFILIMHFDVYNLYPSIIYGSLDEWHAKAIFAECCRSGYKMIMIDKLLMHIYIYVSTL